MKLLAFSRQWAEEFCNKLNQNSEYKKLAHDWEYPLILTMKSEVNKSIYLDLFQGNCKSASVASEADYDKAEFIISATKETWQKIFDSKLDPITAIMMKKLLLEKGSMGQLVKYVNAAKELVNSAKQIDTEF